jgi:hypothetical protein
MKSIIKSSVLAFCASVPSLAVAEEPAERQAPTPVTLPEESEEGTTPSAPASKEGATAKPAPDSKPPKPQPEGAAPSAGPAGPPAGYGPAAVPPGPMFAPPQQPPFVPAPAAPPSADSVAHKRLGPLKSHVNIAVNVDTVWYTGPSFDFFSARNNATSPGLGLGYALWLAERLSVVPELGWSTNEVSQDNLFGGAITRTELRSHNAYGGLSVRYGLVSFLDTHVRVAGGASILDATVRPSGVSSTLEAGGVAPYGTLGGGLSLHSPAGALETAGGNLRSVVAGITVEGGYQLGSDLDLTPTPTGDTGRIPTTYMSLGKLERSGPYLRTSLVVRF